MFVCDCCGKLVDADECSVLEDLLQCHWCSWNVDEWSGKRPEDYADLDEQDEQAAAK